jgi:hypothetical protein
VAAQMPICPIEKKTHIKKPNTKNFKTHEVMVGKASFSAILKTIAILKTCEKNFSIF